jgi:hypothetical protein
VLFFCHFRCRLHRRFHCSCRRHFRWRRRATFDDLFDDFVNAFDLTNNNNANERTKSSNNHFHQRRHATRFVYREIQT